MVFQKPTPFPMSIYDNIAFGIRLYERLSRRPRWTSASRAALRRAALWDEVKDKLHASGLSLSGGQQQRLCIARTIAVKPEVMLLDEPASALDPISTAKIEELIDELKADYTIVIVTHNMQQAARVSDYTAFMYLGELVEFGETADDLHRAARPAHAGLHHRPLRLTPATDRRHAHAEHIPSSAYDEELERPAPQASPRWAASPRRSSPTRCAALAERDVELARSAVDRRRPRASTGCSARSRSSAILMIARRQPMAVDLREIVAAIRIAGDLERDRRPRQEHRQARRSPSRASSSRAALVTGLEHMASWRSRQLKDVLDAYAARDVEAALGGLAARRARSTRMYNSLFRELLTYMMEDPRNITLLHAPPVLRQEHRAHRRPRHQHRRDRALSRSPASRSPTSARRATTRSLDACMTAAMT